MPIHIRGYCDEDFEQVWKLHRDALLATGAFLNGHGPWDDDLKDIPAHYGNNGGVFLVGELQEGSSPRIISMGAVRRMEGNRGEIKRMRVVPEYQRKGLGTQMLLTLEEQAKQLGYRTLQLDTTVLQAAAIGLYQKYGYRGIRRESLGGNEILFMEKKLDVR